jgi:glucokinase
MNAITAVGVDIGGTKTAIAAVSLPALAIAQRIDRPTPQREASGQEFLAQVSRMAGEIAAKTGAAPIGVSICELVDNEGRIRSGHRVRWEGLAAADAFGGSVIIESDVRAAAVAEARLGAGRSFRDIFYVNIGTGISSCWVREGNAHRGARGNALVLASSPTDIRCPHCGEVVSSVPEDIAGGAGLEARYHRLAGKSASARDILGSGEDVAGEIVSDAIRALGVSIGLAVNILDPEAVVIGGGLGTAGGSFSQRLDQAIRHHIWSHETRGLPILRAELGKDSALIGAAILAADRLQGMSSPKLR